MFKRFYLLWLFILLIPLVFIIFKFKSNSQAEFFRVPLRSEQPRDTQVIDGVIPIHQWTTAKKAEVFFVPTEKLPIVDMYLSFNGGSSRDDETKGLSTIFAELLNEGTESLNAEEIAQQFEAVGAEFDVQVTRDRIIISLRCLSDPSVLNPVVELLTDILAHPTFPEDAITRLKNQNLVEMKRNVREPGWVAAQAFYNAIFPNYPYGHLISGDMEGISKITREDLQNYHRRYFVAQNASMTLVGGLHRDVAKSISQKIIDALPEGKPAESLKPFELLDAAIEVKIPRNITQSHVLMGQPFLLEDNQDYFPLMVGNYIFGEGPLVAQLFRDIRDKKGLVYSVESSIRRLMIGGTFLMRFQTKSSQTKEALKELNTLLDNFIEKGPNATELEEAKKGMIGSFPLSIGNNARIAEIVSEITFYKLPLDYLNRYRSSIQAVTQEDIQKAFKKYIHPDKMALIIVGKSKN